MSYHHIQKHVARPLVLWFENDFHHCQYNIEIIFRKYENVKMTIWHITTHLVMEGHIYSYLAAVQVFAFQLQVAEYSQWMEWSTSAATCSLVYFFVVVVVAVVTSHHDMLWHVLLQVHQVCWYTASRAGTALHCLCHCWGCPCGLMGWFTSLCPPLTSSTSPWPMTGISLGKSMFEYYSTVV